jgi:hypothetical protein
MFFVNIYENKKSMIEYLRDVKISHVKTMFVMQIIKY